MTPNLVRLSGSQIVAVLVVFGVFPSESEFPEYQQKSKNSNIIIQVPDGTTPNSPLGQQAPSSPEIAVGKHWIGVNCMPAGDALRAQLGIPKKTGLVVLDVVAGSPADKSGIQKFDVLLKFQDTELGTVEELIKAIDAIGKNAGTVVYIRKAKQASCKVTPERREKVPELDRHQAVQKGIQFLQQIQPIDLHNMPPKGPWDIRVIRPAVEVPGHLPHSQLPDRFEIRIAKAKDGKSQIVVTKDGKSFRTTSDKLETLPGDLRFAVERLFLGDAPHAIDFAVDGQAYGPGSQAVWIQRFAHGQSQQPSGKSLREQSVDSRLKEIDEKLEALQKAIAAIKK